MNDVLLVITDNNQRSNDSKNIKLLPLDKIFYKSKIIDNINNNLMEIKEDENRKSARRIFLIKVPEKYLSVKFYGKKGIKKSYEAKKLIVDKVNLFCYEEGIGMHFYSKRLTELYHIELQNKVVSELESLSYDDYVFSRRNYRNKPYKKGYNRYYYNLNKDYYNLNDRKISAICYNNFEGDPANLGKTLFRSLTLDIIDIICKYRKIQLLQSEITIVGNKENKHDILAMMWKLSQLAKYITIITSDVNTGWIESEAEEIYNNTGLAVNISNNYKSTPINSEVLINYGNVFELSAYEGLKRRTVIINNSLNDYSLGNEKIRIRNPLVDKIEVGFPVNFPNELKTLTPEHFSTNQLAAIILGSKHGWSENKMEQSFKEEGFHIKNLSGSNLDLLS